MWYNLHPPVLRALGLKRKLRLGAWFTPALRALARAKRLRGTPLDVFGYAALRRLERELIPWYAALVERVLAALSSGNVAIAQEILEIPDAIRGYEAVKLANVTSARRRADELLRRLT
jgi:indolepyruvate ferredoxin oxidoreductase